jgi:succinyl-diaminopimelate desuccinylase
MDNYAGYIEMGEGEDLIGILCHVDVVPEGTGWTHPPYSAEVEDGFLYGRGVSDDKGPFIMALYAMQYVRDSFDVPLNKRVRLVIGANEESGSAGVKRYKEIEGGFTCGFSPDAGFPLIFGEKGIVGMVLSANVASDKEVASKKLMAEKRQCGDRTLRVCFAGAERPP